MTQPLPTGVDGWSLPGIHTFRITQNQYVGHVARRNTDATLLGVYRPDGHHGPEVSVHSPGQIHLMYPPTVEDGLAWLALAASERAS